MDSKLAQCAALSQKDKGPAYVALIQEILAKDSQLSIATDLHILVDTVVNQESVGIVIGRQVLSELVKLLADGTIKDVELRKKLVEETLATVQPRIVSYEEQVSGVTSSRSSLFTIAQVSSLRFQLADLLEEEEEWSDAARVLMGISLEAGQRCE